MALDPQRAPASTIRRDERGQIVRAYDGSPLTVHSLPPADTVRWTRARKFDLIACVRWGLISIPEARDRYRLSGEELQTMLARNDLFGADALRVKATQAYRG